MVHITSFESGSFPESMVVIRPVGGLSSRMKCIASFGAIAEYFHVPLYVFWTHSAGFEKIEFDALFDTNALSSTIQFIDDSSWNRLSKEKRVIQLDKHISHLVNDYKFSSFKLDHLFQTRKPFRMLATCNRDLQYMFSSVLYGYIPQFKASYTHILHSFEPAMPIKKIIAHEVSIWGDANTNVLGVHIRRNDALMSRIANKFLKPKNAEFEKQINTHLKLPYQQYQTQSKTEEETLDTTKQEAETKQDNEQEAHDDCKNVPEDSLNCAEKHIDEHTDEHTDKHTEKIEQDTQDETTTKQSTDRQVETNDTNDTDDTNDTNDNDNPQETENNTMTKTQDKEQIQQSQENKAVVSKADNVPRTDIDIEDLNRKRIFLATDDPDVYAHFKSLYKDEPRFRVHSWARYRQNINHPKKGQKKALVDLFTLRFCNRVIGTPYSVFTEFAKMKLSRSIALHTYCTKSTVQHDVPADTVHTMIDSFDDETEPEHLQKQKEQQQKQKQTEQQNTSNASQGTMNKDTTTSKTQEAKTVSKQTTKDDTPQMDSKDNDSKEKNTSDTKKETSSSTEIKQTVRDSDNSSEQTIDTTIPEHADKTSQDDTSKTPAKPVEAKSVETENADHQTTSKKNNTLQKQESKQESKQSNHTKNNNQSSQNTSRGGFSKQTLIYLFKANPDAVSYQKQMRELLSIEYDEHEENET